MPGQQLYRQQTQGASVRLPAMPQAGGPPRARMVGVDLLNAVAGAGQTVLGVLARDHVRRQQGQIDDAVLAATAEFDAWKGEYMRTHQGRDALNARQDFADTFAEISERHIGNFDGAENQIFMGELQRRMAAQGLYAVRDGGAYQRQQDEIWQKSQLEGQLAAFGRMSAEHYDDPARLDNEILTLTESWRAKNPGLDDTAFRHELQHTRDIAILDGMLAAGRYDDAQALLDGGWRGGGQGAEVPAGAKLPADVRDMATAIAGEEGVDPALVLAVIHAESGGDAGAVSRVGARGLMQLMPGTAAELGVKPDDPADNIRGGTRYLKQMLARYGGNVGHALAAYNAGPGRVDAWLKEGGRLPRETQDYVPAVMRRMGRGGGNYLSGLTSAERLRYGAAVQSRREAARKQAEKSARRETVASAMSRILDSVGVYATLEEQREAAFAMADTLEDRQVRDKLRSEISSEFVWREKRQDATTAREVRRFQELARNQGWTPRQAADQLDKAPTMSEQARAKLEKDYDGRAERQTPANKAALAELRRLIDLGAAGGGIDRMDTDALDAWIYRHGLTFDQGQKALNYAAQNGVEGELTQTQLNRAYKALFPKRSKAPGELFGLVADELKRSAPGKPVTDVAVRQAVARLYAEGESDGSGWLDDTETWADAVQNKREADWEINVPRADRRRIEAVLREAGVKPTDDRVRAYYRQEMGFAG